ncbi:triose-phosphate isomerase family protein [Leifsonia naganoensis]|uniref:Triosephosphate isomerase n=1 Tax=Leifsonia naganoensis TaxID=150025 RepID=A0A853DW29_9MICO|nr:triose-phosphate isomerase family protein [Leifsonia naganoensis]NYK11284.1 triosephosphate isomerase [Leifsonia naganoensis]
MTPPLCVGVSLKMYFGHTRAQDWLRAVAARLGAHPALVRGEVELFVIPSFVSIPGAVAAVAGTPIVVGAQDVAAQEAGAFTGEVSALELAEAGVGVVEVGHAERRRLFGEDDDIVAAKTGQALAHGLAPVLCVGEARPGSADAALAEVLGQLRSALHDAPDGRVIVAYEPVWAIGAAEPAPVAHIQAVCRGLQEAVGGLPGRSGSRVIYGGSAGPGLLTALGDDVDGLFLGRFAHDVEALAAVVDEAARRVRSTGSAISAVER